MKKVSYFALLFLLIILISGCIGQNTKENAEAVAQKFAIELQKSNYENIYDLFTPELKSQRSKEDFTRYMTKKGLLSESSFLVFDKVVLQGDNEAYAYYTFSSGVLNSKMPPVHLVFTSEGWRIDALQSAFMEGCIKDSDCTVSKPRCNENFDCVSCITDQDCKDRLKLWPYCSRSSYTCEECVTDNQCPANKPKCFVNKCEQCRINSDCPSDRPFCNYDLEQSRFVCNTKEYGWDCVTDSDCPYDRPTCSKDNKFFTYICTRDGQEIECLKDAHCPYSKPYCNRNGKYAVIDENQCVECRTDVDCKKGEKCVVGGGLCI